mmetsp:Transcript_23434/g.54583  ORF Transcript_23434/g.54583 Transcript_23434/m.54583 type:complete len:468 (+) Transcript_23434:65-1468(+)
MLVLEGAERIRPRGDDSVDARRQPGWGDSLELATGPDKKKYGSEDRVPGLAWASCCMRGWRESMEDAHLMMPSGYLGGAWRESSLFCVFDGHGGEQVARLAARKLPDMLAEYRGDDAEEAFVEAFRRIDESLRLKSAEAELRELTLPGCAPREDAETTGTTAVCCLLRGSELTVAHCGDSRAVLSRQGKAVDLTEDHKPNNPEEAARIEAAGGFVQEEVLPGGRGMGYRVNGNLNLSRALGNLRYKDAALSAPEHMVSGVPETRTLAVEANRDDFVFLGCDGVFECMSNQEVVNFVRRRLPPPGQRKKLVPILEALLDACCADHPTQRGGLGCDNMTAVLFVFEDPNTVVVDAVEETEKSSERTFSASEMQRLDAMLSEKLQRLSSRDRPPPETPEEKAARLQKEREEEEERERKAQEEIERRKRRQEREEAEKAQKKKARFCAALDDNEGEDDDDNFDDGDGFDGG